MAEPAGALTARVRPVQVLLGVGAVLLVSTAGATAAAHGGPAVRALLVAAAAAAGVLSAVMARRRLRSSEETFAAAAAGLAAAGTLAGGPLLAGSPLPPLLLTAVFLAVSRAAPGTATWPLAAWAGCQLAALRALAAAPVAVHTEARLGVALVGLGVALFARRGVARVALLTTAPWWLAGVVEGTVDAWTAAGGRRWIAAGLVVGAAAGLVPARLRHGLGPLLGPPRAVPVVAGLLAGAALTGALAAHGTVLTVAAGYAGVWLAGLAALLLGGWRRGLFLPLAVAAGTLMAALCVVRLAAGAQWGALSLLLLLAAAPALVVAVGRPADRPATLPAAVGCGAGAALLALADGVLAPGAAAACLTALYAVGVGLAAAVAPEARHPTLAVAAVGGLAALLAAAGAGGRLLVAAHLAVQGLFSLALAHRGSEGAVGAAWRIGAAQLVAAAWLTAAAADRSVVEAYTLPLAAGLLLAAGPRALEGPSWPVWGPALLVAAVPSTVLAVVPGSPVRVVTVLVGSAVAMLAGARAGVRAPLLVGAGCALAVPLGLAVRSLPWPLATAAVVGVALLAVGARRERRPAAAFGARLADLR